MTQQLERGHSCYIDHAVFILERGHRGHRDDTVLREYITARERTRLSERGHRSQILHCSQKWAIVVRERDHRSLREMEHRRLREGT